MIALGHGPSSMIESYIYHTAARIRSRTIHPSIGAHQKGCRSLSWLRHTCIWVCQPSPRCGAPAAQLRPAASRASNTHFSGLGPPWRSHPCIEGYPQCQWVRAVGMERSDRQHQPIADTQSRFTVYVTGGRAGAGTLCVTTGVPL